MSVYVYCLKTDYKYQSSVTGREFENEWLKLDKDGAVVVKGTHYKGYAWDGGGPGRHELRLAILLWRTVGRLDMVVYLKKEVVNG